MIPAIDTVLRFERLAIVLLFYGGVREIENLPSLL